MSFLKSNRDVGDSGGGSSGSSVASSDSYEVFGVVCSDFSDCELCEDTKRRARVNTYSSTSPLLATSSFIRKEVMIRRESAPLLGRADHSKYNTLTASTDTLGPAELLASEILSTYKKQFEDIKPEQKTQSSLVTIFSVWNTIIGSSLLTMAWGVERAGLPSALVLVAFMSALCLYTAHLLLTVNTIHGSATCEVPALCGILLGKTAQMVAHTFSLIVLLGANIVYWILITNFLYFTVNYVTDLSSNSTEYNSTLLCPRGYGINGSLIIPTLVEDSPYWGLHTTVPVYVFLIIFPLLNFRNVQFFTKFNSLGTLSVAYVGVFVCSKVWAWGVHNVGEESTAATGAAALSGLLALSFYIHNIIITIMNQNRRQDKNGRDLTIAFILVTLTYTLVGAVFYICFPLAKSCIEDNILNNFEMHDAMTAVARILLLFQVITVFPLVAFMLRSEAILLLPFSTELKTKRWLTIVINLAIVSICIIFACFCPNIGTIIRYTGAISGLVHVFALPSLLQLRSLQLRQKLTWWKIVFYVGIITLGTVNLVMQFFIRE